MPNDAERPILGISGKDAADILGVASELYVSRLVSEGVIRRAAPKHARHGIDRAEVERVALDRYRPGHPNWATAPEAAALMGVTSTRVRQLATWVASRRRA